MHQAAGRHANAPSKPRDSGLLPVASGPRLAHHEVHEPRRLCNGCSCRTMKPLTRRVLTIAGVTTASLVVVCAAGYAFSRWVGRERVDVARAIPDDARVVLLANTSTLRHSVLAGVLLDSSWSLLRTGDSPCAKQVWDNVERLAVWQPQDPTSDFALAAFVPIGTADLWQCVQHTVGHRGGAVRSERVNGFFTVVDDRLGPNAAQIAFRDDGVLLVGQSQARDAMIDTLAGRRASMLSGIHKQVHDLLRDEAAQSHSVFQSVFQPASPSARSPSAESQAPQTLGDADLLISVVVGPSLRERAAAWIGEATSLLDEVQSLGMAAYVPSPKRKSMVLQVVVTCDTASACLTLAQRLETLRERASKLMALRLTGIASLLTDQATLRTDGRRLSVLVTAQEHQVKTVIEGLTALSSASKSDTPDDGNPPAIRHNSTAPADEPLPAPDKAASSPSATSSAPATLAPTDPRSSSPRAARTESPTQPPAQLPPQPPPQPPAAGSRPQFIPFHPFPPQPSTSNPASNTTIDRER